MKMSERGTEADFRWRAFQCRTNADAFDLQAAGIWDLAADALRDRTRPAADAGEVQAPSRTFEDGVEPVFPTGWGGCPDDVCCENPECPDHGYPALKRASFREGIEAAAKVAEMWDHRGDIAAAIRKRGA